MSDLNLARAQMQRAEKLIARALELVEPGSRLLALHDAFNNLPPGDSDAFVAVLLFHVALDGAGGRLTRGVAG